MYVYNNKKGLQSLKQILCKFKFNPLWLHRLTLRAHSCLNDSYDLGYEWCLGTPG